MPNGESNAWSAWRVESRSSGPGCSRCRSPRSAEDEPAAVLELDGATRERCLAVLRSGLASDEFWPSMHAAEALSLDGHGAEVRAALGPKLATEKRRSAALRARPRAGPGRRPLAGPGPARRPGEPRSPRPHPRRREPLQGPPGRRRPAPPGRPGAGRGPEADADGRRGPRPLGRSRGARPDPPVRRRRRRRDGADRRLDPRPDRRRERRSRPPGRVGTLLGAAHPCLLRARPGRARRRGRPVVAGPEPPSRGPRRPRLCRRVRPRGPRDRGPGRARRAPRRPGARRPGPGGPGPPATGPTRARGRRRSLPSRRLPRHRGAPALQRRVGPGPSRRRPPLRDDRVPRERLRLRDGPDRRRRVGRRRADLVRAPGPPGERRPPERDVRHPPTAPLLVLLRRADRFLLPRQELDERPERLPPDLGRRGGDLRRSGPRDG